MLNAESILQDTHIKKYIYKNTLDTHIKIVIA